MTISRRDFVLGSAGALGASALGIPALSLAANEDIKIGWLAALTGPSSAPGVGFNRGVEFAAQSINAAGGVKGRKIVIVTRDTQGDPTKAVNATQEMINSQKVQAIWGPTNSGESLAVTPIMARAKIPNIHPCVIDSLVNVEKYPNAFRISPSNSQWDDACRNYCLKVQKLTKIAVIGDTTGYGVSATKTCVENFKKDGAQVVYASNIDATQPDMSPDLTRARDAGAEVIVVWSVSTGMEARLFNARAHMGWDVAFAGHPSLASGEIRTLIEKPENWDKVYAVGYKSASYDADGKLPAHSQEFVDKIKGKVSLEDTLYWWVSAGYDAIALVAKAIEATGSTQPRDIIEYWNGLKAYPGYFGSYTYTPAEHNGYPTQEVVMSEARSARNGTFALAPGYQ
ncbi:ABC transporter substrate-binding protein [Pollutimonas bauzanensis]|uniref:Branched-chain amino acid transport system substrate-binding protein n=1 Tax=Pollutimonas bauzanensis TaxID=658167 RepID=A0A1M5X6N3_9BURK|nr:ABC transporter substrate-binding protein [Pollutimonas bauzanensis]SHH95449.1 branched-chain amino acid transport system substrate-binding protein [Pollutimonas bauzanensis]